MKRQVHENKIRRKNKKNILDNHYEWCKANGRDTSWYGEYKRVSTRKKLMFVWKHPKYYKELKKI